MTRRISVRHGRRSPDTLSSARGRSGGERRHGGRPRAEEEGATKREPEGPAGEEGTKGTYQKSRLSARGEEAGPKRGPARADGKTGVVPLGKLCYREASSDRIKLYHLASSCDQTSSNTYKFVCRERLQCRCRRL